MLTRLVVPASSSTPAIATPNPHQCVAKEMYGADRVEYTDVAEERLALYNAAGYVQSERMPCKIWESCAFGIRMHTWPTSNPLFSDSAQL